MLVLRFRLGWTLQRIAATLGIKPGAVDGRVDVDALDLAGELLLERLEGREVVAEDQPVVEEVVLGDPVGGVVRLARVLNQNARLQLRPILLADPSQFKFGLPIHTHSCFT